MTKTERERERERERQSEKYIESELKVRCNYYRPRNESCSVRTLCSSPVGREATHPLFVQPFDLEFGILRICCSYHSSLQRVHRKFLSHQKIQPFKTQSYIYILNMCLTIMTHILALQQTAYRMVACLLHYSCQVCTLTSFLF